MEIQTNQGGTADDLMNMAAIEPQQACSAGHTYRVERGDSFYLIARRLGVPLRDLMNANPTFEPTRLMVGDVLCVPYCSGDRSEEHTSELQSR